LSAIEEHNQDKAQNPTRNILHIPTSITTSVDGLKTQVELLQRMVLVQDASLRANFEDMGIKFAPPHPKLPEKRANVTLTWFLTAQTDFQVSIEDLKARISWLRRATAINCDKLTHIEHLIGLEFTLFPKLPTEIKSMIWKLAVYVPRIVTIKTNRNYHSSNNAFFTTSPPSPLLLATRESRAEVLKVLRPLTKFPLHPKQPIVTNPLVDTLWILSGNVRDSESYDHINEALQRLGRPGTAPIPRLALPYRFWKEVEDMLKTLDFLDTFKTLGTRELILVVGDETLSRRQDVIFQEPEEEPGRHSDAKVNKWYSETGCWRPSWELLAEYHEESLEDVIKKAGGNGTLPFLHVSSAGSLQSHPPLVIIVNFRVDR
jgi:hypothetical protein